MRDVGIIIWVIFLIVGVVGSMVSKVRRLGDAQTAPQPGRRPSRPVVRLSPPQPASPVSPPAPGPRAQVRKPAPQPAATHLPGQEAVPKTKLRLFATGSQLVRAVIAAEVLGKPRGLGDEYFPH